MSGRGGARPGAGRKPGVPSKRTRTIEALFASMNYDPIEQMIHTAKWCDDQLKATDLDRKARMELVDLKSKVLSSMAPYLHPKRAASTVSGVVDAPPVAVKHEFGELPIEVREVLRNTLS